MKTALLFAGQGAQHVGMGRDLVESHPEAKALFDEADQILENDFSKVCFEGPEEKLTDTSYCQPALFVHGLALLSILKKEVPGLTFKQAAGLSLGEFTAHTAAGHFNYADGLKLVAARGRLMQEACLASEGGMLTLLGGTLEEVHKLAAASDLEVANINCPGQTVLSGAKPAVEAAVAKASEFGFRRALPLKVAGAYHSKLMAPAQEGLKPFLDAASVEQSDVTVYSNVTGKSVTEPQAIREMLLLQVTGTVNWQSCIEEMVKDGTERFIELGPGKVLAGMLKRINPDIPCLSVGAESDLKGIIDEIKG